MKKVLASAIIAAVTLFATPNWTLGKEIPQSEIQTAYTIASMQLSGYKLTRTISVKATAYCACKICCGKTDGITCSGTITRKNHTLAVDPKVFPLGTKIYIPELNQTFVAEDTGGKIKGNRIDIYMEDHSEALSFGVKEFEAFIIEKANPYYIDYQEGYH